MLISIKLPWACGGVVLDSRLHVEQAPPIFAWMMGRDFFRVGAPWIERKVGSWQIVRRNMYTNGGDSHEHPIS
jgi:hypothetical protein